MKVLIVPIVTVVLLVGLSAAAYFMMMKPQLEEVKSLEGQIEEQYSKLAKKAEAERELAEAKRSLREARAVLARYKQEKGIPVSFADRAEAAYVWFHEVHQHSAPLLKSFLEKSGVAVMEGSDFPPPPEVAPYLRAQDLPTKHDMVAIPDDETPIAISVQGTIEQVEALFASLDAFPRILVIDGLQLEPTTATVTGTDDKVTASFNMYMYAFVEGGEEAAAAPAAGGAPSAGGMPSGPSMAGMGMPPGAPTGPGPPGGGATPGPPGGGGGGEDDAEGA
jgi:Tfp pilus assembly protein PilO